MTWGEIYNRVVFQVWGNSVPPAGTTTVLTGPNGLIGNIHREIQQRYNFWFMRTWIAIQTTAGTSGYNLPDSFKEEIKVQFKIEDKDNFESPLIPLNVGDPQVQEWIKSNNTAEYPDYYEIQSDAIFFYPVPNDIRTFHLIFYQILPRPPLTFDGIGGAGDAETDEWIKDTPDTIISLATSRMLSILKEIDAARHFKRDHQEQLEMLMMEDTAKTESQSHFIQYKDV